MRGAERGAIVALAACVAVAARTAEGEPPRRRVAPPVTFAVPVAPQAPVREPAAGSAERTAILDQLRARIGTRGRFQVHALRVSGDWAFVHATEVVALERGEVQETDLTAMALLQRRGANDRRRTTRWSVVELWTLPTDERRSHADFMRAVTARERRGDFPVALIPDDVR